MMNRSAEPIAPPVITEKTLDDASFRYVGRFPKRLSSSSSLADQRISKDRVQELNTTIAVSSRFRCALRVVVAIFSCRSDLGVEMLSLRLLSFRGAAKTSSVRESLWRMFLW